MRKPNRAKFFKPPGIPKSGAVKLTAREAIALNEPVAMSEDCDEDEDSFKSEASTFNSNAYKDPTGLVVRDSKTHTWSSTNQYFCLVIFYTIQNLINRIGNDLLFIKTETVCDFEYDYLKTSNILTVGSFVFVYNKKIYALTAHLPTGQITIKSNHDISDLIEMIDHEIKWHNPLRKKHLYVVMDSGQIMVEHRKIPKVTFKDVILKQKIKDDIFDNTIFQIKNIEGTNGIILYGDPGVGKSFICQAVVAEAIAEDINTCFTTAEVDYVELGKMIELFLNPCILTIEDIDSIAQDREKMTHTRIANFLQFVSGLSDLNSRIVFIATTNHIDQLDKAVRNRPMRFNRKIRFEYPDHNEIDLLVDVYFRGYEITKEMKEKCYVPEFSGAHIKELFRTCDLISKKTSRTIEEVFVESVDIIKENFSIKSTYIENKVL